MTPQTPTPPASVPALVRELMERHSAVKAGENIQGTEEGCDTLYDIWHNFPSIASHLLSQEQQIERMRDAAEELIEVARLRGDNNLPHPADDTKHWTARMQEAWDALEEALSKYPKEA